MSDTDRRAYAAARALVERKLASSSPDAPDRDIHVCLAERYEAQARPEASIGTESHFERSYRALQVLVDLLRRTAPLVKRQF